MQKNTYASRLTQFCQRKTEFMRIQTRPQHNITITCHHHIARHFSRITDPKTTPLGGGRGGLISDVNTVLIQLSSFTFRKLVLFKLVWMTLSDSCGDCLDHIGWFVLSVFMKLLVDSKIKGQL